MESFKCGICHQNLRPPIRRCETSLKHLFHQKCISIKNKCVICNSSVSTISDDAVEMFILMVKHKCSNCLKEFELSKLDSHEKECINKRYCCEMNTFCNPKDACTWEGSYDGILSHFRNHKRAFLNNPIRVEVKVDRFYRFIQIVEKHNELFFYKHVVKPREYDIHFAVQLIGSHEKAKSFLFKLKIVSLINLEVTKEITFTCFNETDDIMKLCRFRKCPAISIDELKTFLKDNTLCFYLDILKVDPDQELPVLFDQKANSDFNQQCGPEALSSSIINNESEDKIIYKCESNRFFKPKVPCNWFGPYEGIETHFQNHKSREYWQNPLQIDVCLDKYHRFMKLERKHNNLFYYKQAIDPKRNKMSFTVQLIGTPEEAKSYIYEFKLVSLNDTSVTVDFSFPCFSDTEDAMEVFKSRPCGIIPLEILQTFVKDGRLSFYLNIIKVNNNFEKSNESEIPMNKNYNKNGRVFRRTPEKNKENTQAKKNQQGSTENHNKKADRKHSRNRSRQNRKPVKTENSTDVKLDEIKTGHTLPVPSAPPIDENFFIQHSFAERVNLFENQRFSQLRQSEQMQKNPPPCSRTKEVLEQSKNIYPTIPQKTQRKVRSLTCEIHPEEMGYSGLCHKCCSFTSKIYPQLPQREQMKMFDSAERMKDTSRLYPEINPEVRYANVKHNQKPVEPPNKFIQWIKNMFLEY